MSAANTVRTEGGRAGVLGEVNPGFCLLCPACGRIFGPVVPTPEMNEMAPVALAEKYFPELIQHEKSCHGRVEEARSKFAVEIEKSSEEWKKDYE